MSLIDYSNSVYQVKIDEFKKAERILNKLQNYLKEDLTTKRRMKHLVYSRYLFYKLCRDLTKLSLEEIGRVLGYDHSSVVHGLKQYDCFEMWGLYDYIKLHRKICKEFGDTTTADRVEDLIKENIRLRYQIKKYKEIIGE